MPETVFHGPVPDDGRFFRVLRDTWNADYTRRDVYEWEYGESAIDAYLIRRPKESE